MERARHRKSKSASGIEGIRQIQQQKAASRLSSDSRSYIDGSHRDDMFMLELGQRSLGRATGIPMKKLLAEEMSKEVESKKRSPSVIARLMGLDGLPSPRHVHRQQKRYTDSYQHQDASVNVQRNSQLYDGRSNRRSSLDHQEFKDVYEDLEASHVVNRRCSSRWSASSILTKPEMALIRQKFIDAKRLSADEMLQDSKELDDTLEMLDSNKDLLLKFLQQPDSLFVKHLHDLQVDPGSSLGSRIAVLKPSNSEKYESKAKAWRSERDTSSKHQVTSHLKRKDGLLLEPHNRHRSHVSRNSSRIQLEEKNEDTILPTRIVVLKPNLGKMQNSVTSISSPDQSNGYLLSFKKIKEYPSVRGTESVSSRRKDPHIWGFSKVMSKEAREIAREITMRMRDGCDETMDAKSTGHRGYVGDESSYDANESDSDSDSEVFNLSSRKSFDDNKLCRYPSSHLGESSVNREAKKRLTERWKMTHKYQDLEMVSKGSTLGEMLALPDSEIMPKPQDAKMNLGRACGPPGSSNENAIGDVPLGISSRDGWKDEISRNSSRSRSVPPSTCGRSHRRSRYQDELAEDKHLMHIDPVPCGGSNVTKGNLSQKADYSYKDSKSRSKKPLPCQHIFTKDVDSSSEANFEIQMEANTKDLSEHQSMFQMAEKDDTCKSPVFNVMMIAEPGSTTLSLKSSELLSKQSSSVMDGDKAAVHDQKESSIQEPYGPPIHDSPSLPCLGPEPDSSESSKEADHPSPISVLEMPFTEDTSSSESFERVSAELHELRMQLQLLKMESGTYAESSTLVPIEEEVAQLSPITSEENYPPEDKGWEISYALDVLIESGLEESELNMLRTTWHSPHCPLDPKLFDNLEKKYSDDTSGLRSERRLLFERINSAILEIFQEHVDMCPWVRPKLAGLNLEWEKDGGGVRDAALEKLISQELSNDDISERVVDREMWWSDGKGEIEVIGNEIEKLLIDDMITEVVCN
ncbi:uncharacterized protein LOC105174401 isoform X1 [Sesamum indicum]|uniref:Uncharacterized protein LOC105174401 isoform X1 n=2 Tax=Sesamum indicum TaxID=4182 RepID=A0A8M8VB82_SESIN|nr:uncharacterized protein LOC105174401 isoform X1 [Sesamum indicum]